MSRIDEALRRANSVRTPFADHRRVAAPIEPRAPIADASELERYQSEDPSISSQPPLESASKVRPAPSVPSLVRSASRISIAPSQHGRLVISPEIAPFTVEQYRRLATVLKDLQDQQGIRTLMVSSAAAREGKTHTVTNLALTLSDSFNQRVLLLDADLRRPSLHDVFGVPVAPGLVDVVRGSTMGLPLVELSPNLSLLAAGDTGATPLRYLASESLPAIIKSAAARFEWVLIDTPPIGLLPDAHLVARMSEAIVFVVAAGVTPYSVVQRGVAALDANRIVGLVFNRAEERTSEVDSYYGNYPPSYRTNWI